MPSKSEEFVTAAGRTKQSSIKRDVRKIKEAY
jgi:hypothetical protein